MARCTHKLDFALIEHGTSRTTHTFTGGEFFHHSEFGDYTGVCTFECYVCGWKKTFNRHAKSAPKWLKSLAREMIDLPEEEQTTPAPRL